MEKMHSDVRVERVKLNVVKIIWVYNTKQLRIVTLVTFRSSSFSSLLSLKRYTFLGGRKLHFRQQGNDGFLISFFLSHSMERLPTLQYQLLGEFHTLLEYPSCSAISRSNLLQMMAINMFAIEHTSSQGE